MRMAGAYNRAVLIRRSLLLVVCLAAMLGQALAQERAPLTVMTFNIRYGTANDGENRWPLRKDFLVDVIKAQNADVVGLQEALDFQIDEIVAAIPAYAVIGVGRDDGARKGEYAAVLFRRDRFQVSDAGTFWFSDTPTVIASKSWGNRITRICTWARFIDRDGRGFWHFNLHLDHQSQPSRERSTELLRRRIEARAFAREPGIAIAWDESLREDDFEFVAEPGVSAVVIKPTLTGSLAKVREQVSAAHALGLTAVISSSIESSLGLTQLARIAAWLTPDTIPGLDTLNLMQAQLVRTWPDSALPCFDVSALEPLR